MIFTLFRSSRHFKFFTLLISTVISSSFVCSSLARGADQGEIIYQKWEEIISLRSRGEYTRAIEILNKIIEEYSDSEDILKRAYNHLVFTFLQKKDDVSAMAKARDALDHFPDLAADIVEFPPTLNDTYDQLRREMFGSLWITRPEGCRVFLNEEFKGEVPLHLDLVKVGEHDLMATKSGYHDYTEPIRIDPNGKHMLDISMDRKRNFTWWLYRVGPPVLTGVILAIVLGGEGGGGAVPEPQPLPAPPPPPQ